MYFDYASYYPEKKFWIDDNLAAVNAGHFSSVKTTATLEKARYEIADFISADNQNVFFPSSSADALEIILDYTIENLHVENVIIPYCIFPVYHTVLERYRRRGLAIHAIKPDNLDLEGFSASLSKLRNPLVIFANPLPSGKLIPVKRLINAAKKGGALTAFDFSLSLTLYEINASSINADFVFFDAQYIDALKGAAVLYVAPGHKIKRYSGRGTGEYGLIAGQPNVLAVASLAHSLTVAREKRGEFNLKAQELKDIFLAKNYEGWTVVPDGNSAPSIVSLMPITGSVDDTLMMLDALGAEAGKIFCGRDILRISFGYETTQQEVEQLSEMLFRLVSEK